MIRPWPIELISQYETLKPLCDRLIYAAHQIAEGIWSVIENHGQVRREVLGGRPRLFPLPERMRDGD
jgi:hypothetical protein